MQKLKVAIVGTHGVPAKYGGFETLADFLCQNLSSKLQFIVYCNKGLYDERPAFYHGARLKYLPLNASGFFGIIYDVVTFIHALFTVDKILYLSPVGSGFIIPLKFAFGKKVIVNHGGLNEWDRPKLSWFQRKWAKFNHLVAAKAADVNIVDNKAYRESLRKNFGVDSVVVRYGGDHVAKAPRSTRAFAESYRFLPERYAISVSRAQIDNNLHLALEAFSNFQGFPLVLVSNWQVSEYGKQLKEKYANSANVILLDAVYDKAELDYLRGNAFCYIHTHSFCGTAPSLVEAMCLGLPIFSLDVETNRETTNGAAFFFNTADQLVSELEVVSESDLVENGKTMKALAQRNYLWETISNQYLDLIFNI